MSSAKSGHLGPMAIPAMIVAGIGLAASSAAVYGIAANSDTVAAVSMSNSPTRGGTQTAGETPTNRDNGGNVVVGPNGVPTAYVDPQGHPVTITSPSSSQSTSPINGYDASVRGAGTIYPAPLNPAPLGAIEPAVTYYYNNIPCQLYHVGLGDTLSYVSDTTGRSVDAIANANDLRNVHLIYDGSALCIPL